MNKQKDYYKEIDEVLKRYEEYKPYYDKNIDWAVNKIDWCWKWRKITEDQMEELTDRVIKIFNQGRE